MSSLDSQFLCLGTMFTNDMVTHYLGEHRFDDRRRILIARAFILGIVAVTYLLSLAEPRQVFPLGVWCFSGFTGLFPLVFAAIYWRRATKAGAIGSVLVTAAVWLWLFHESGYGADADYTFLGMMPVATVFGCAAATLIAVSLLTPAPSEKTLRKFFQPANKTVLSGAGAAASERLAGFP
jgi:SSS family solute:Na+ symporter